MIEKKSKLLSLSQWLLRILITAFSIVPIYTVLIIALTPGARVLEAQLIPHYFHVQNFTDAFRFLRQGILNSFLYATAATLLIIVVAVPAAYALSKYKFKGKPFVMFLLLVTQMMAGIIIMPALYSIFSKIGLVNQPVGTILVLGGINMALVVWILHGYFQTLPAEIEEAAMLDGASYLGMLVRIIFPISGPGIAVGAIFAFINAYNEFVVPLFLLSDASQYPVTLLFYTLLTDTTTRWHILSAGSLIAIIPPIILFTFFQKYIVKGITSGAVKS